MGDVILYKEDVDRINFLLKKFINDAKILSAFLITKDTRVLGCQGMFTSGDTSALAALIIGSFASTQAIAGLIGETEFDTLSHSGKTRSVIISCIDNDTILASIFDKNSSSDRIHAYVLKHQEVLKKALRSIGSNTTQDLFNAGESSLSAPDDENEFETRTAMLSKNFETEQPQSMGIKPPPDTKMIVVEQTSPEEVKRTGNEHAVPVGQTKDEINDAKQPKTKTPSVSAIPEELLIVNGSKTPRIIESSLDNKAPESGSTEAFSMSMNYLKNKTREGALYYHHDKAFFKKFFKSSHKKKV